MTTDPTVSRPEVDDPRVLALAQARQQLAYENPFNAVCPPWDGLTKQEQHLSLLDARSYLHAALRAGLAPAAVSVPPPAPPADAEAEIQVWPLQRVLTEVRCGSEDWSWEEEWADLDRRHAETGYLNTLEQQIRANGITMPVLIGSDGRLWDGHHRLRLAVRLGIGYVPVEITPRRLAAASGPCVAGEQQPT